MKRISGKVCINRQLFFLFLHGIKYQGLNKCVKTDHFIDLLYQDRPLPAVQHHPKNSNFVLTERNTVNMKLAISRSSSAKTDVFFDLLPEPILVSIFRYLPLLCREKVNQVNKRWNYICKQYDLLELFCSDVYGMMIRNMVTHRHFIFVHFLF